MLFAVMPNHAIADTIVMGRLINFPTLVDDSLVSDDRIDVDADLSADFEAPARASDPSDWGIPRTFFVVPPSSDDFVPETNSVS